MFSLSGKSALAIIVAALCLGGATAHAQTAPVRYWIPGWPIGFGSTLDAGQNWNTYGNFPSFDFRDAGVAYTRADFPNGMFVGSERGDVGLSMSRFAPGTAVGNFSSLSYESVQFGYNFQNERNLPLTVYAGFDTVKYRSGIGGPLAAFDVTSGTLPVYSARAGIAYQPTQNLSLSVEVVYTQQGQVENDGSSLSLLGMSPSAFGPRR